jgi:hypothetical protein
MRCHVVMSRGGLQRLASLVRKPDMQRKVSCRCMRLYNNPLLCVQAALVGC